MNEVKNPVKTLKSAASAALLTACILYLLVNAAYFLVVPAQEIADSGELIAALFFEKVFGANGGRVILPIAVALSAAGNVMVTTFSHVSISSMLAACQANLSRLASSARSQDETSFPSEISFPPRNPSIHRCLRS